jgi:hypothetical protein
MVSLCNKTLYEKLRKMFDSPDGNIIDWHHISLYAKVETR